MRVHHTKATVTGRRQVQVVKRLTIGHSCVVHVTLEHGCDRFISVAIVVWEEIEFGFRTFELGVVVRCIL